MSCGICQLGQSSYCRDACMNSYLLSNGICEDGGPGSEYSQCPLGTDCSDCGIRFFVPPPSPASPPDLPSPPAPPAPPPLPFEPPTPPAPPPAPVVAFSNWNSYSNPSGWTNGGHTSSKYVGTSYSFSTTYIGRSTPSSGTGPYWSVTPTGGVRYTTKCVRLALCSVKCVARPQVIPSLTPQPNACRASPQVQIR